MNRTAGRALSHFATIIFLLFCSLFTFAGPARTTYQAKIIKPDGYPLEAASVNFKFTILDPAGACILYSETYSSVNMNSTGGLISFSLGSGVKTYPVSSPTFEDVFSNISPSLSCDVGGPVSYSPLATDTRKIVMQFHDGSGWQTLPAMNINAVPYAMFANEALTLNGKADSAFVEVANIPTCLSTEALRYNGTSFSCITTSEVSAAAVVAALGYTPATGASVTALTSSLSTTDSLLSQVSATVFSVSSTVSSLASSVSALTSSQWLSSGTSISYGAGNVGVGTSSPTSLLHLYSESAVFQQLLIDAARNSAGSYGLVFQKSRGNTSLRTPSLNGDRLGELIFQGYTDGSYPGESAKIRVTAAEAASATGVGGRIQFMTTAVGASAPVERVRFESDGHVGIGTTTPVTNLDVSGGVRISMEPAACAVSFAGTLRYNSGLVEYCNGTAWSAFGVAGAGITLFNGSASGTQSFVTGISGTNFNISSVNGVHSFNIPLASSAAVTAGLLSNADYVTFNSKVSATSASVITALGYTPASAATVATLSTNTAASFSAITSSQWVTSGSEIHYNSGYVGIGVSAALSRLTVANITPDTPIVAEGANSISIFGDGHTYFQGRDVTNGVEFVMGTSTAAGEVFAGSMSDHSFTLRTGNNRRMVFTASGAIGVGITSPTAKLHIGAGSSTLPSLKLTSSTLVPSPQAGSIEYDGFNFFITDGSDTRRAIASDDNANFTAGHIVASGSLNLTNSANLYLTATASDVGDIIFQEASGTQKGRIWSNPSAVGLFLSSGDTTPDITINAAGNVGIGTQTPTEKLEVSGAIKVPGVGQIGPAGGFGYAMYTTGTNNFIGQMYGAASGIQFTNSVGSNTFFISENGRTGLGTSSPAALLNLVGTDAYNNLLIDSPNYSALTARGGATSGWPLVQLSHQGVGGKSWNIEAGRHSANSFGIYDTASGVTRFSISSVGNIGIGTVAPTNTLDVVGFGLNVTRDQTFGTVATFKKAYTATFNEDPYVQFLHQTASGGAFGRYGYIQSGQSHSGMTVQAEDGSGTPANLMLNKSGGSVGVGTSSAASMTARFNVVGSSGGEVAQYIHNTNPAGYSVIRMNNNWGGFASGTALHSFGPGYGSAGSAYSPLTTTLTGFESGGLNLHANVGPIRFFTGGNDAVNQQMHLTAAGNFGIGTSSPTARLNIGGLGAANATALRIDSQDTYYRDIFMSEFNTTTYGGILRYNSGSDLLQLITLENSVEKYGIAVARATGFVGVGRNSAAAYQLDVSGSVRISGEAFRDDGVATWAMTSDARLKDVVSGYDRGLNEILNIDTIVFKYKKDNPKKLNSEKEFPGVLAQQVQKVIPEAVDTDKDGFLSLNTTPIIWAMLNAIKDVYHEVTGVQREIASLKEENIAKEQEIKELKERLDRIEKSLQNK